MSTGALAGGEGTTSAYYRGLVEGKCDNGLKETLGFNACQLANLHRRTFSPGSMDNFQRSLAWMCFRNALPVRDKLLRHSVTVSSTCPRCGKSNETVLHAIIQRPCLSHQWVSTERLLSQVRRVQMSAESIIKIVSQSPLKVISIASSNSYSEKDIMEHEWKRYRIKQLRPRACFWITFSCII